VTWLITALGACIGVATGLLGAGGSILTVLLLVHASGLDIQSAVTTSLVVVAGMSVVAFVPYARAGAVVWRAALSFGFASMAGAALGGHLSTLLPSGVLLVIFLMAMMVAAAAMLWERPPPPSGETGTHEHPLAVMAGSGFLLGILTGTVGLGGGFAVVPLLVVFARAPVRSAVGTSILIIAMNTLAGLAGHLPHLSVHWGLAAYLGVAEILGGLLGVHFIERVSVKVLRRGFAGLMLAAAVFLLGDALLKEHRARSPSVDELTTNLKGQAMTDPPRPRGGDDRARRW
jgi:uncharacterized membrane protein YfcA